MAENKKSFLLYCDLIHTVEHLPNDVAGKLFKHVLKYVNDEKPVAEDMIVKIAFEPIKQSLKRDLLKWGDIKEKRSDAGKASAAARKKKREQEEKEQTSTNPTSVETDEQTSTNPTVSVSVSDSVSVSVIKDKSFTNKKKDFLVWFNFQKEKHTGTAGKFRTLSKTDENNFKQLLKDYSKEDFLIAIPNLFKNDWAVKSNNLTPAHFLRVDNFNKYLNTTNQKQDEFKNGY